MTEEETICDRTYRAYERQKTKPDKPETCSLPRHSKQDHKVQCTLMNIDFISYILSNRLTFHGMHISCDGAFNFVLYLLSNFLRGNSTQSSPKSL